MQLQRYLVFQARLWTVTVEEKYTILVCYNREYPCYNLHVLFILVFVMISLKSVNLNVLATGICTVCIYTGHFFVCIYSIVLPKWESLDKKKADIDYRHLEGIWTRQRKKRAQSSNRGFLSVWYHWLFRCLHRCIDRPSITQAVVIKQGASGMDFCTLYHCCPSNRSVRIQA